MTSVSGLLYETSTVADGNMDLRFEDPDSVIAHRVAFLAKHNKTLAECVQMNLEHDATIMHASASDAGRILNTEALITTDKNLVLMLLTADCFPIVMHDKEKGILAIAHLGWKPATLGLIPLLLKELQAIYNCVVEDLQVYVGPGIHKESYAFEDPEQARKEEWAPYLNVRSTGETEIDLHGFIRDQLLKHGVKEEHITDAAIDTARDEEYFSHYRAIRTGEQEGRFATIAALL